jgi:hypothetical protein
LRRQLMTGSGHMEWNEGRPLAVRRYGINQKKCKFLFKVCKCIGKAVV